MKPGKKDAEKFIEGLAKYLVENTAMYSMMLQIGKPEAQLWSEIRSCTNLFGYPPLEEAKETLRQNIIEFAELLKEE